MRGTRGVDSAFGRARGSPDTLRLVAAPRTYRVIAQGDDAVGVGLPLDEAIAVFEFAREHGKQHVAIVDESTGAMLDEGDARAMVGTPAGSSPG